jgi:hypothetical protein
VTAFTRIHEEVVKDRVERRGADGAGVLLWRARRCGDDKCHRARPTLAEHDRRNIRHDLCIDRATQSGQTTRSPSEQSCPALYLVFVPLGTDRGDGELDQTPRVKGEERVDEERERLTMSVDDQFGDDVDQTVNRGTQLPIFIDHSTVEGQNPRFLRVQG